MGADDGGGGQGVASPGAAPTSTSERAAATWPRGRPQGSASARGRTPTPRRRAATGTASARAAAGEAATASPAAVNPAGKPEREPGADPAGGDRPVRTLDRVDVPVGVVVERHPGEVQAAPSRQPIPASAASVGADRPPRRRRARRPARVRTAGSRTSSATSRQRRARAQPATFTARAAAQSRAARTAAASRCSSVPSGSLKKNASSLIGPLDRPRARAGEPTEVEHERRGQRRVAALPGELQLHPGAEEALEETWSQAVFHSPRSRDVLDPDRRLDRVAEDLLERRGLRVELRLARGGIGERGRRRRRRAGSCPTTSAPAARG